MNATRRITSSNAAASVQTAEHVVSLYMRENSGTETADQRHWEQWSGLVRNELVKAKNSYQIGKIIFCESCISKNSQAVACMPRDYCTLISKLTMCMIQIVMAEGGRSCGSWVGVTLVWTGLCRLFVIRADCCRRRRDFTGGSAGCMTRRRAQKHVRIPILPRFLWSKNDTSHLWCPFRCEVIVAPKRISVAKMAFTLWNLFEATLLCLNAVCILHEERFLAKSKPFIICTRTCIRRLSEETVSF